MGTILIVQRLPVPSGLLPDSAVTVSTLKESPPLFGRQAHFDTLLTTTVIYLNILCGSIWTLFGIRRKWFLRGEPPRWIKIIFENNQVVPFLYFIFGITALYSAVMVARYIRELGHGLGYW
jgi:hypothetical protein